MNISFKEAYLYKSPISQHFQWGKKVWSADIPPSKSLLAWRLMHNKLPTDENMMGRGWSIASICSSCNTSLESTFHLFFQCSLAMKLWSWFASLLNTNQQFNSAEDIWKLCDKRWTPQCKVVVQAVIINILSTIWFIRNQARFKDKKIHWKSAINNIIAAVSLTGNRTKLTSFVDMDEFVFLKAFKINIHPPRAPLIKEVLWIPPTPTWIKVNTNGALTKNPNRASCGGVFRDHNSIFVGAFAQNLNTNSAFNAELLGIITAINIAVENNWMSIWLETDSQLAVLAFKNLNMVPWSLKNKWLNCLERVRNMNFLITHIYREGNSCADIMANVGLALSSFVWFPSLPNCIRHDYGRNRLGMPSFRFI